MSDVSAHWIHPDLKRQIIQRERRMLHNRFGTINTIRCNIAEQVEIIDQVYEERQKQIAMLTRTLSLLQIETQRIKDLRSAAQKVQGEVYSQLNLYISEVPNSIFLPTTSFPHNSNNSCAIEIPQIVHCAIEDQITKLFLPKMIIPENSNSNSNSEHHIDHNQLCHLQLWLLNFVELLVRNNVCQTLVAREEHSIETFLSLYTPIFTWNAERQCVEPPHFTSEPCLWEWVIQEHETDTTLTTEWQKSSNKRSRECECEDRNNKKKLAEKSNKDNNNNRYDNSNGNSKYNYNVSESGQIGKIKETYCYNNLCVNWRCLYWHSNQWNRIFDMLSCILHSLSSLHVSNSLLCATTQFTTEWFCKLHKTHNKVSELCRIGADLLTTCIHFNWYKDINKMHAQNKIETNAVTNNRRNEEVTKECKEIEAIQCYNVSISNNNNNNHDANNNNNNNNYVAKEIQKSSNKLECEEESESFREKLPVLMLHYKRASDAKLNGGDKNDNDDNNTMEGKEKKLIVHEGKKSKTYLTLVEIIRKVTHYMSPHCDIQSKLEILIQEMENCINMNNSTENTYTKFIRACTTVIEQLSGHLLKLLLTNDDGCCNTLPNVVKEHFYFISNSYNKNDERHVEVLDTKHHEVICSKKYILTIASGVAYFIAECVVFLDKEHEPFLALELLSNVLYEYVPSIARCRDISRTDYIPNKKLEMLLITPIAVLLSPVAITNLTLMFIAIHEYGTLGVHAELLLPLSNISDILFAFATNSLEELNSHGKCNKLINDMLYDCLQLTESYTVVSADTEKYEEMKTMLITCLAHFEKGSISESINDICIYRHTLYNMMSVYKSNMEDNNGGVNSNDNLPFACVNELEHIKCKSTFLSLTARLLLQTNVFQSTHQVK